MKNRTSGCHAKISGFSVSSMISVAKLFFMVATLQSSCVFWGNQFWLFILAGPVLAPLLALRGLLLGL